LLELQTYTHTTLLLAWRLLRRLRAAPPPKTISPPELPGFQHNID
jgi:hypothetical protein